LYIGKVAQIVRNHNLWLNILEKHLFPIEFEEKLISMIMLLYWRMGRSYKQLAG